MNKQYCFARLLTWLTLAGLLAGIGLTPALPLNAATSPAQIEPGAGKWQTWVLKSGSELRPAAPPDKAATQKELAELQTLASQRDAKALDQIAYWDAGSPNYRWNEIALAQIQSKPISNPRIGRLFALLNVAIYDAIITAWDAKYTYNRQRPSEVDPKLVTVLPNPASPAYPSEQAVAAGAASAILAYIYPDDAKTFEAKAEEAGRSRLLAGVNYPSDVTAGLALGRAVAAKVIERAKADGSDAKWTGTAPTGLGKWKGDKPLEPLAGSWKPWVLSSGSQLRSAPPPAYDSAQQKADLAEIRTYTRTLASNMKALYWQSFDGINTTWFDWASRHLFEQKLDTNAPRSARAYALLSVAQADAYIACFDSKYTYWAARPDMVDPTIKTMFPDPPHPTYPSAHGCVSYARADVLAYLFPSDGKVIQARAEEAGQSRMWAGIHFRSDIEAGSKLGQGVAALVIEHAKHDGAISTP
ncbi:MAG: vanadium-dependent haloperoxidase [Chloroflexi bacterium]|nr:vanadium-dependent haloperoxidase [Chloroflexota bacterium]